MLLWIANMDFAGGGVAAGGRSKYHQHLTKWLVVGDAARGVMAL